MVINYRECLICGVPSPPTGPACPGCGGTGPYRMCYYCDTCRKVLYNPVCDVCAGNAPVPPPVPAAVEGETFGGKVQRITSAVVRKFRRTCSYAYALGKCRVLGYRSYRRQLHFGERLLAAGGGDAVWRDRITALDAELAAAEAGRGALQAVNVARRGLLLLLAADALATGVLPDEVQAEAQAARDARLALDQQVLRVKTAKAELALP